MDREYLLKLTADFSDNSPTNFLAPPASNEEDKSNLTGRFFANNFAKNNYYGNNKDGTALDAGKEERCYGMRFFKAPIMSIGSASDPGFRRIQSPEVVGPHHLMPEDWLPNAKSVISLFLPFSDLVINANRKDPVEPAIEWLYTRVDGQQHLLATGALVRDALIKEGYNAVVPYADDRFIMRVSPHETNLPIPAYSSNWSERHVGYVTGLGTFGKSTNFISRAGASGRLISIVTDWETTPDIKDYDGIYDYCSDCGACYRACPGNALSEKGKDIQKCTAFLAYVGKKYRPRYGCGKCQSGGPCATRAMKRTRD